MSIAASQFIGSTTAAACRLFLAVLGVRCYRIDASIGESRKRAQEDKKQGNGREGEIPLTFGSSHDIINGQEQKRRWEQDNMSRYRDSIASTLADTYSTRWRDDPLIGKTKWFDSMEDFQFEDKDGAEHTCYMWRYIGPMMQIVLLYQLAMLDEGEFEKLREEMDDEMCYLLVKEELANRFLRCYYDEKTAKSLVAAWEEDVKNGLAASDELSPVKLVQDMYWTKNSPMHDLNAFIGWMGIRLDEGKSQEEVVTSLLGYFRRKTGCRGMRKIPYMWALVEKVVEKFPKAME